MSKRYVDIEELENLFKEYSIPYTNIFDELREVSAEKIASSLSVSQMKDSLESKEEVFAVQVWQKEDIKAALAALEVKPDDNLITDIMIEAKGQLEDCSDNWERLHNVINQVRNRRTDR